jgi:predicted Kef-type K+ transport protein
MPAIASLENRGWATDLMDFEWVAIGLQDVLWIALAFVLGSISRVAGLPPLVGFLVAGFVLNSQGVARDAPFEKLADLGVTLLLFTVGLKLSLKSLARPQVWAVSSIHMAITVLVFSIVIYAIAAAGIFAGLDLRASVLVGFALSFSSTVFAVKLLEEAGESTSLHGRIVIGILLIQDVAAVAFLAMSTGKLPSVWALLLFLVIPLRSLLHAILQRIGHGELLVLYSLLLALGGAEIFELVGLKGDLGALVFGVLMASHERATEMAKVMLAFKDLFLLGFFLSIGMSGEVTGEVLIIAAVLTPFIFVKSAAFFALLSRFGLRARTSLRAAIKLNNYSEFGLIVLAVGVEAGWIGNPWLIAVSIALALSFAISAALNASSEALLGRFRSFWMRFQKDRLIADDQLLELGGATIAVIGMGRVGRGAYDAMREQFGDTVVGIDIDPIKAREQRRSGRNVLRGDPSDKDFWDRVQAAHTLELVMLALPKQSTTIAVLDRLRDVGFQGHVASAARYPEESALFRKAGAMSVFNIYTEAGTGFAAYVTADMTGQGVGREEPRGASGAPIETGAS